MKKNWNKSDSLYIRDNYRIRIIILLKKKSEFKPNDFLH